MTPRAPNESAKKPPGWSPYALAFLACFLYWLSLPPFKQPWAAYVAAIFFAALVYWPKPYSRKDYLCMWWISSILWLALLQGVRLAFWPLYAGWIALSLYVAIYIPIYVSMARSLRSCFFVPFPFACAISWTGMELFRAYFATGFSACMLGHSQTPWPAMLQLAATFGTYGISFMIMLFGATICFGMAWFMERAWQDRPNRSWSEVGANYFAALLIAVWIIGSPIHLRQYEIKIQESQPIKTLGRFLIIQENMPTLFDVPIEDLQSAWRDYARRTIQELQLHGDSRVDVILWPESTFGGGNSWYEWDGSSIPPGVQMSIKELAEQQRDFHQAFEEQLDALFSRVPQRPALIAGAGVLSLEASGIKHFNAVLWFSADSSKPEFYAKRHLVMFGEYIPLVSWFPQILGYFGMAPLAAGDKFVSWRLESGTTIAPSICFEDVVPHFIQRQVRELDQTNHSPDILINVTNDGWFRGSSILDHHLNNAICAAVENRRPLLIAANSGISAWIDGSGRIVKSLDRFQAGAILAEPIPDGRNGLWQRIGDLPAKFLCLIALLPALQWLWAMLIRFGIRSKPVA